MDPILDEQQAQMHESAVRLCRDFAGPARLRALQGAGEPVDAKAWQQLVQAGWPQLMVPEAQGGLGMGLLELALMMDQAGQQLLQAPILQACAARYVLAHARSAGGFADDTLRCVPALVDEGDAYGQGARWLAASAQAEGFTLTGHLPAVAGADAADVFIVPARLPDGGALLLCVPAAAAGLQVQPQACIDGSSVVGLGFRQVPVALGQVLAEGADADRLHADAATLLRVGAAAELVGVASRALAMTLEHLKTRKQFGKLLGSFQALQHRCVDVFVDIELNRSLLWRTCAAWDKGQAHPAMVSALKSRASHAALAATRVAVQLHGAMGYTEAHDIGLYYKRAVVLAARYGNENHHAARFSEVTLAPVPAPAAGAAA